MAEGDWPEVRRIYAEGIATGDATFETEVPDWSHWDRLHRPRCRLVARDPATGTVVGWAALSRASSRRVYARRRLGERLRGRRVARPGRRARLLEALIPASEEAGYWTLQAGILSRTRPAWPSTSASASAASASRNGSGAMDAAAGATASCSSGGAHAGSWPIPDLNVWPRRPS